MDAKTSGVAVVTGAADTIGRAEACLGEIDVVVHCAGAGSLRKAREGSSDFPDHATCDVRGTLFVLAEAAKCLFNGGRIVFFSGDLYAKSSWPANGRHVFSAVRVDDVMSRLTDCMRRRNITVNALSPKSIAESLYRGDGEGEQRRDRLLQPIQRVDGPEDIASVISFLVAPQGGWVNGQVIRGNCAFA